MKTNTREKILSASAKLFSEKGFTSVRTKEIAKKAGINEVTLFRYFKNKKNLYHETFVAYITKPTPEYLLSNVTNNPKRDLQCICNAIIDLYNKNTCLVKMSFREIEKFDEVKHELGKQPKNMVDVICTYLEKHKDLLREDINFRDSANHFVITITGMTFHYIHHTEFKDEYPLNKCAERFVRDFTAGILKT